MNTVPPAFAEAIADRYRVERELGRGGMATVYLAHDLKHGRSVAIKVMDPALAAEIGPERFHREIRIAAGLAHPNILPLHDSGEAAGQLYYVMPYVAGESLRARLGRERQLALDDALRLARELAAALGHAHDRGLVHRDVKPENVLLADGIAQLADFGVARANPVAAADATAAPTTVATGTGVLVGTPLYMAPEQALGTAVDGRADQYALACVLYEMLAGAAPFAAATVAETLAQHLRDPMPPLGAKRAGLPPALEPVLARALAKDPVDRFGRMAQFAEALTIATSAAAVATPTPRADPVRETLPTPRSRFFGRERELRECAAILADERLLTITGIGGSGKTRFAIRLADELRGRFADGVWFVDLAQLTAADRVTLTLATVLGVHEESAVPILDAIVARLRGGRALIVLDNCEHVLDAVCGLADALLGACDGLCLIATSREGLGVAGERIFAMRSLPVPPAGGAAADLEASDAVRLFVDRARGVVPQLALTPDSLRIIADICRRLDGIPLAIELAAARLRVLSLAEIEARLDDRFRLLTGGSRSALPRHQTLQATLQWSHDMLGEEERSLLRGAAVFAGGWTLEALTRVADEHADEFEVLDRTARLVDKSWFTIDPGAASPTRYTMLETVRQFAADRLEESGEGDVRRGRHLDHFVAIAERGAKEISGAEQARWRSLRAREHENFLAAHAWAHGAPGREQDDLRLAGALLDHWNQRGVPELGRRVLREALDRPGAEAPTAARARAAYAAGNLAYFLGAHDDTRRRAEECLRIAGALGDAELTLDAHMVSAMAMFALDDYPGTHAHLEQLITLARRSGDPIRLSRGLCALGDVLRFEDDPAAAEPLYLEARALNASRGDHSSVAIHTVNLALVAVAQRDEVRLRRLLREILEHPERLAARTPPVVLDVSAAYAGLHGEPRRLARWRGISDAARIAIDQPREREDEHTLRPVIDAARVALGDEAFAAELAAGRALPIGPALEEARVWLASHDTPAAG